MNFSIFGSCVTRDIFTHSSYAVDHWNVDLYLSRATCQSVLASSFEYTNLSFTGFDDRRFRNDLEKKHFSLMETDKKNGGFFLIDFIDERHAVYVNESKVLTFTKSSKDYINSLRRKGGKLIRPGDKEWDKNYIKECIINFVKKAVDIRGTVFIQEAYWACSYYDLDGLRKNFEIEVVESCNFWNAFFEEIYSECARIDGVKIYGGDVEVVADQNHKWGLSPYHYSNDYYDNLSLSLLKSIQKRF